jgi:arginase
MDRELALIGTPSGAGACGVGQEQAPMALRAAGLVELLAGAGLAVDDLGDSQVIPWRPDRSRPEAQNLEAVVEVVRTTATRVAAALEEGDRTVVVLGGDCTVGIGTIAGVRAAIGDIAVVYFDLHSDLNTPESATDGALDWMALAHMLALEGSEPTLTAAAAQSRCSSPSKSYCSPRTPDTPRASNEARSSDSGSLASPWKRSVPIPSAQRARRSTSSPLGRIAMPSISTSTSSTSLTPRSRSTRPATPG